MFCNFFKNQYIFKQNLLIFWNFALKRWIAVFLCEAIVFFFIAHYILLASLCLSFSLPLSRTLIYTQISDESPSSHHHSGTQKKPVPHSHIHKHTPPQCCSVRTHTVPECKRRFFLKTYSTNSSVVRNNTLLYYQQKDQQKHGLPS